MGEVKWICILNDINFYWEEDVIKKVRELWNKGASFKEIDSECIGRNGDEVFLLLLHLSRRNLIKEREGFVWGI